jgi:predicted site-specific integrase-resolvase
MTKNFYNTETAAKKMGVGFRTLNRWLELGKIKSVKSVVMPGGRTL